MKILLKHFTGTVSFLLIASVFLVPSGLSAAEITFRVIMSVQETLGLFNPAVDQVVIRGSFNDWGDFGGGEDLVCEAEDDSTWAAAVALPTGVISYKFAVVYEAGWSNNETIDPRSFEVGIHDTVLDPVYFNDREPDTSVRFPSSAGLPEVFSIISCQPNPFNDSTTLLFSLPSSGVLDLIVIDLLGREITRYYLGEFSAGIHTVPLRFSWLSSGRYFCVGSFNGMRSAVSVTLVH